jgi:hypothetical protein
MLVLLWFYRAGLSVCADFLFTKLGSPRFFSKSGTGGNYARLWQECHLKPIWSLKLTGSVVLLCCWFPCTSAIMINFRLWIFRFQNDKWHLRFTNVETVQWEQKMCIRVQVCLYSANIKICAFTGRTRGVLCFDIWDSLMLKLCNGNRKCAFAYKCVFVLIF